MEIHPIAHIYTDFTQKFGIPRQSGIVPELMGRIVFEPKYAFAEALKGLAGYSHLWLIWEFSENQGRWSPTVRPPRLGGNTRVGVFATRSPFRPNSLGLSCVKIEKITEKGDIVVSGVDMLNGTPIYDIKPYLPHIDSHPDALAGFAGEVADYGLEVDFDENEQEYLRRFFDEEQIVALAKVLSNDPRPSYQNDSERIYGMCFAHTEIRFRVDGNKVILVTGGNNDNTKN